MIVINIASRSSNGSLDYFKMQSDLSSSLNSLHEYPEGYVLLVDCSFLLTICCFVDFHSQALIGIERCQCQSMSYQKWALLHQSHGKYKRPDPLDPVRQQDLSWRFTYRS